MVRSGEAMTSITPNRASRDDASEPAAESPAADSTPFVLNLCSSTTPMALAQVDLPELKRFTFFVSRRFEEGRERFRLHMGYFATLGEAEEWLSAVRDIYPGAWAGEAPGKKLRARAAAAAAVQGKEPAMPQPQSALPNFNPVSATAAAPKPAAPVAAVVVTPAAVVAPAASVAPVATTATAASAAPAAPVVTAPAAPLELSVEPMGLKIPTLQAAASAPSAPAPTAAVTRKATAPKDVPTPKVVPPVLGAKPAAPRVEAARGAGPAVKAGGGATVGSAPTPNSAVAASGGIAGNSPLATKNVTPAIRGGSVGAAAAPGAGKTTSAVAGKAVTAPPAARSAPGKSAKGGAFGGSNVREVLAALDDAEETGETRMMPAPQLQTLAGGAEEEPTLTDTQVLRYLESRRSGEESGRAAEDAPDASISLLKPDDTGTRRALKEAVSHNAPVSFAVQLHWAVQPVELDKVPPLAIFSAYTLYTVEGSREGRKWYGLRLGFFSDAISAKQVAYYVRSEFASVAVVPVSPQEKARATVEEQKSSAALPFPRKTRQQTVDEFKLIDSDGAPAAGEPAAKAKPAAKPPVAQPVATRKAPTKGARVNARERRGPQTLEETLEILGAGQLEIDNGNGETLNESGVRHLRVEVQKSNTPFSRLLERLSERTRKS